MKNKLYRILAVVATLALMASFAIAVPVSAAPGCNDWDDISMPVLEPDTEVGVMDIAPDGTMFAAFYDEIGEEWDIKYSTDGGFKWKNTNLIGIYDENPNNLYGFNSGYGATPVRIQVSPMWPDNKNVYVALSNGEVWRLPDAGLGTPAAMRSIVSDTGASLEGYGLGLWDMDIWADGTYNYLAVATDLDVFVIKDALFEVWIDYELNVLPGDEAWWDGPGHHAVEVRFAPDFGTSEIIWAVIADGPNGNLWLTSADAPTRWGYVYEPITFEQYSTNLENWTPFVDMEFDEAYSSAFPMMYVAVAQVWWNGMASGVGEGNLYLVTGESSTTGPGDMASDFIFFEDAALGTVEVSDGTILTQNSEDGTVWITDDAGANWEEAARSPAAPFWGQLFMAPDFADSGIIFSTVMDGYGYDGVSGIYRSTDGGHYWDGISWLDMDIDDITDLAFDPKGGSQPALMVVEYDGVSYIFYTPDAAAASPQWLLKDNEDNFDVWAITMISWDEAGDTVMFMADQDPWEIYRSTDDGNSFKFWRQVPTGTIGQPTDWVVVDGTIVSVVGRHGYWGTKPYGTPNLDTDLDGLALTDPWPHGARSVARFGDIVAVGTMNGEVAVSEDGGATWDSSSPFADYVYVYVAFGPDGTLYAATDDGGVYTIDDDLDADLVEDSNGDVADAEEFSGIWVSPDNTLYAIGGDSSTTVYGDAVIDTPATVDLIDTTGTLANPLVDEFDIAGMDIIVTSGTFEMGDAVDVLAADVKAVSSSIASGTIYLTNMDQAGTGYITITVYDSSNPFAGYFGYPADIGVVEGDDAIVVDQASSSVSARADLYRLLLGDDESDYNVWENEQQNGAWGIWGTASDTNILWTVVSGDTLYAFEDFNSGTVQDVVVEEVSKSPSTATKSLKVSWTALACTTCYTIWIDGEPYADVSLSSAPTAGTTLTKTYTGFDYAETYEVQVQACVDGPIQSRLGATADVTTECYLLAPAPSVPEQGLQGAPIAPSFVWSVPTDGCAPTGYDFQLSTDPAFASTIVSISTSNTGYTYVAGDLAYDTNHYWRVRSVYGSLKSAWTTIQNFHTMLEPQPPVDVTVTQPPAVTLTQTNPPAQTVTLSIPPAQTVTVSVPPAVTLTQTVTSVPTPTITLPDQPTPVYIWIIVAVGAILTIAVIVLIIRTRRAE